MFILKNKIEEEKKKNKNIKCKKKMEMEKENSKHDVKKETRLVQTKLVSSTQKGKSVYTFHETLKKSKKSRKNNFGCMDHIVPHLETCKLG